MIYKGIKDVELLFTSASGTNGVSKAVNALIKDNSKAGYDFELLDFQLIPTGSGAFTIAVLFRNMPTSFKRVEIAEQALKERAIDIPDTGKKSKKKKKKVDFED